MKSGFFKKAALTIAVLVLLPTLGWAKGDRSKAIDFEDEIVEGLNKKPLDSMSQLAEANKRKRKPHLYRKRGGFRDETRELLRYLRYSS